MSHPWEEKWILGERLGKGGQGITCAVTSVDDATVEGALKYLKHNKSPQARGRMRREVANLQTLADAGGAVPRVLGHNTDQFEDLGVELFVVMDLVRGQTLDEYVAANQPLEIDTAIRLTLSVCATIKIAHTFPIVHRDLKPENIIVCDGSDPDVMIVDYGLSFNVSDEDLTETDETFRNRFLDLPETNTPGGDRRDQRSDLTAVCAILYFCLTGHAPGQLLDGEGKPPHMREGYSVRAGRDDERVPYLEDFLTRGFPTSIANRYQQAEEIEERLVELLAGGQSVDEADPVKLASSLSRELRAKDRTTQIADFRKLANTLFQYIQQEASKYVNQLGRFGISYNPFRFQPNQTLPPGLDLVAKSQQTVILTVENHSIQRHRLYVVASRGEQCVLLAADYATDLKRAREVAQLTVSWDEIASFEGDPTPVFDLVSLDYKSWLTAKMKELHQEVLERPA